MNVSFFLVNTDWFWEDRPSSLVQSISCPSYCAREKVLHLPFYRMPIPWFVQLLSVVSHPTFSANISLNSMKCNLFPQKRTTSLVEGRISKLNWSRGRKETCNRSWYPMGGSNWRHRTLESHYAKEVYIYINIYIYIYIYRERERKKERLRDSISL